MEIEENVCSGDAQWKVGVYKAEWRVWRGPMTKGEGGELKWDMNNQWNNLTSHFNTTHNKPSSKSLKMFEFLIEIYHFFFSPPRNRKMPLPPPGEPTRIDIQRELSPSELRIIEDMARSSHPWQVVG